MTLTLKIIGRDRLENGSPIEFVLHNRGAIIGRSATCEWPLPDDGRLLSRNHCKIIFADGAYMLEDMSVNGTFLGQSETSLNEPHRLKPDDQFRLGTFKIHVRLSGEALNHHQDDLVEQTNAGKRQDWKVWDDTPLDVQESTSTPDHKIDDTWGIETAAPEDVSHWSDKQDAEPVGPTPDEVFDTLSKNHEVDWDTAAWDVEADFDPFLVTGDTISPQKEDSFGSLEPAKLDDFDVDLGNNLNRETANNSETMDAEFRDNWKAGENPTRLDKNEKLPSPIEQKAIPDTAPKPLDNSSNNSQNVYRSLIATLGISSESLSGSPDETAARAGRMLRRLLAGLVTLLEARARAKDAMGASATQLCLDGNNPLKFARDIDQALQMVMNPAQPGYMEIDLAIEDSYRDLQAHQIATLKGMQGALKSTLNKFSPDTVKAEAKKNGFLTKILPGQRDAALWRAYEKQFNGSVQGSAEAFFDTFSIEFRKAYEDETKKH